MSSIRSASSITSKLQSVEHDLAALEQVHQASRRRDQDVDALFQRLDLVAHLNAADQQRHRERVVLAVFLEILGDLLRQLARRLEDQRARHARAAAAVVQDVDHRQDEAWRSCRCRSGRCRSGPCPSGRTGWRRAGWASVRRYPLSSTARSNSSERPRSAKVIQIPEDRVEPEASRRPFGCTAALSGRFGLVKNVGIRSPEIKGY